MMITMLLSLALMAALFLMLFAAGSPVQNKRLFTSAPKDIQAAVRPKPERFPGQHVLGRLPLVIAVVCCRQPSSLAHGRERSRTLASGSSSSGSFRC